MLQVIKKDIQSQYYQDRFDNDGQRFVAWYVQNIHGRDSIETFEDVTDGPDDKQIDAIVVDDDSSTIFVIQGKFLAKSTVDSTPLQEVLAAWVHLKDTENLQRTGNQKLKRRIQEVVQSIEDGYLICFELIVTGALTASARSSLARFRQELADSEDFHAELQVVGPDELKRKYEIALQQENPRLSHELELEADKYMVMSIDGTKCVVAAVPLQECLKLPGIRDGSLFQKNVRQSLGLNNRVNKGIKETIYSQNNSDFFFRHNGITAICESTNINDGHLTVRRVNVVNGCQSLNTIQSCSERVKELSNAYVMFRFYEIPQRDRAELISISTNSQSAVKPRDLRSNDTRVLAIKRSYEQRYPKGYFISKRGEKAPADKEQSQVVDLLDLGKYLMAWYSQRPNVSYSENKIFDKHFEQLFKRKKPLSPENIYALNQWMIHVRKRWQKDNPLTLNESLLAMKAYAPYHHLYAVSLVFCKANSVGSVVPTPHLTYQKAKSSNLVDQVVDTAGTSLNVALEAAANEPQPANRVFSPQNWIKTKKCLAGINQSITNQFFVLRSIKAGQEIVQQLTSRLNMGEDEFEERWAAD